MKFYIAPICFTTILLALCSQQTSGEPLLGADNVCNITIPFKKDIVVEEPVEYRISYDGICSFLPCKKTRVETRINQTTKSIIFYKEKRTCCEGYTENHARNCVAICLKSCNNGGQCVAPNVCRCSRTPAVSSPGFAGPTCSRFVCLGENRWGSKCDMECNCPTNSYCSASTGKCICYPGFRGTNCSIECGPDSNSPECDEFNELPPIAEPDANLISDNTIPRGQLSEALHLERTPDETLIDDSSSSRFGTNYLVGLLACLSLLSFISFLMVKFRYDKLKTDICYASGSSNAGGSDYSNSPYYATTVRSVAPDTASPQTDSLWAKNLSFAAATRTALSGGEKSAVDEAHKAQVDHDISRQKLLVNPVVETHLIRSHRPSEQNHYSEAKVDFSDRPLPNIEGGLNGLNVSVNDDDNHIYQVPRPRPTTDQVLNIPSPALDTSSEQSLYKSISEDMGDETIYEEITPKKHSRQ